MKLLNKTINWLGWLISDILEYAANKIGKPMAGCIPHSPETPLLTSQEVADLPVFGKGDGIIDLDNTHTYDQGRTPHCVCYGALLAIETMAIAKYQDNSITFDRGYYSQLLRDAGIMTDRGARIDKVMDWFTKNGVEDTLRRKYKIGKAEPIIKSEIFNLLDKGYPIVTGAFWGSPYYDHRFIFQPRTLTTGGGHCTILNKAYDLYYCRFPDNTKNEQRIVDTETSWGDRFGIKKKKSPMGTGRLHVLETDLDRFFTSYIFTDVTKI